MRKLMTGLAVVAVVALSARTEAHVPEQYAHAAPLRVVPLGVTQVGWASWYGLESAGKTASGEAYDIKGLTAAHRTLPLNSKIKVTNLNNGRSVVVRINDRGPNVRGRLLDVSRAAAERLGFIHAGKARVRLSVVRYPTGYVAQPNDGPLLTSCAASVR